MKEYILPALGVAGGFLASLFGGWSAGLTTLIICMILDYATGLIVGGLFHKSPKTADGTLESRAGWKGLVKKLTALAFVAIGYRLEIMTGQAFVKDAVCVFFVCNEVLSIIENAGLMGVPIPTPIRKAISLLQGKGSGENEQN